MKKGTIFFISIIILILIFIFKVITEPSNEEPIITESEPQITGRAIYEETPIETQDQTILDSQEPQEQIIPIPQIEIVSRVRCIDDKIELLFTNPTNKTLTFVEDIIIHLNGMIVVDPECYRYTINPGKRVFCNDISGHLPIRKGRQNLLQLSTDLEKFEFVIDCENQ